jgi:TPP-dependent pyruvate/acetoin dehydrogenase alpha subunit
MSSTYGNKTAEARYEAMYRIRRFEEKVLEKFPSGVFLGTTHTYIGQEANAVGVLGQIGERDAVFSNHRCHGHFLAYGGEMRTLFAELMGSNGVLGSTIPVATGVGLAGRLSGGDDIVVLFMGDGAFGEGVVYEAFNMAALWKVPVLFVVENNGIAQTTPLELALAGDIARRFDAFGIPATDLATSDVEEIAAVAEQSIDEVREGGEPRAMVIRTNRFAPHSKGDDTRPPEDIEAMRANSDPLLIHATRLTEGRRAGIEEKVDEEVERAFATALADPEPLTEAVSA